MQMTLGKQIKMLRTEKGLTQAELGEILGKGGSTVRMWELDKSSPDRKALYREMDTLSSAKAPSAVGTLSRFVRR